jgi:hypothetical protein
MSGSDKQTQDVNSSTSPWAPQAGALSTAFNGANSALSTAQGVGLPANFVSQFTPDQLATFKSMLGYSNNNTLPSQLGGAASANLGAGTNATTGALSDYNTFDPSQAYNAPSLINTANQYVAGQNIPAQVQAAMQQGVETARDTTLPGIEQNAATSGNTDSSRTGVAQGIVERGLGEQAANLNNSLTGQAFGQGLGLASSNANNANSAMLSKLSQWGALGSTATNSGLNLGTGSITDQGSLYSMAQNAGQGEQAANQAYLDNQLQQYQQGVQAPFTPLNEYMGVVGSNNWGSNTTGTQTTTSTPSAWSVIGGLLGAAGGAAKTAGGLGWKPLGG